MLSNSFASRAIALASLALLAGVTRAADAPADAPPSLSDLTKEVNDLKSQIAQLKAQESQDWLSDQRAAQIQRIVQDALNDAKTRSQLSNDADVGYKDGFYIQSPNQNFKLTLGGYFQARYEFEHVNATGGRSLPGRTVGSSTVTPHDPGDASGFNIRKARITLTGNVITPDLTFKLEGDFYGGSGGAFTVTDAFAAYRFTDQLRVRAGSYKVPFAKAELIADPLLATAERAEVMTPFDPLRALGVSLYGDLIKNKLSYEVSVNDGGNTNTLRRPATTGLAADLDNRPAAYGRIQWAGSGSISDFAEESDLRTDNRAFIWMLGAAAGYESQNASNNAFPSPQTSTSIGGLSNGDGPGFTAYTLNGDAYRATLDWSAKYQGLSFNTAAYFQQINANPGNTSSTNTTLSTGPFGAADSSFFQHAYYAQVGYFIWPQKLELIARGGLLLTEGYPNLGEVYTLGANYYIFGQNLKIQSDVTFTPESPFTDPATGLLQNTHDVVGRIQLQAKF